ncbi:MAG: zinc-ribbon domain-containing protein [Candidatus Puniceispirillales bacterium]
MLLNCPHCETIFRIDVAEMPSGGRKVRCSVCRHVWKASRGGADIITEDADLKHHIRQWWMIFMAGVVVIVLMAMLTLNRNLISANMPGFTPFYETLGLNIGPENRYLEISGLNGLRQRDTIRLSGEVINTAIWSVHAPKLQITVTDTFGIILAEKTIRLDTPIIEGKEVVAFQSQVQLDQEMNPDQVTDIIVVPLPELSVD